MASILLFISRTSAALLNIYLQLLLLLCIRAADSEGCRVYPASCWKEGSTRCISIASSRRPVAARTHCGLAAAAAASDGSACRWPPPRYRWATDDGNLEQHQIAKGTGIIGASFRRLHTRTQVTELSENTTWSPTGRIRTERHNKLKKRRLPSGTCLFVVTMFWQCVDQQTTTTTLNGGDKSGAARGFLAAAAAAFHGNSTSNGPTARHTVPYIIDSGAAAEATTSLLDVARATLSSAARANAVKLGERERKKKVVGRRPMQEDFSQYISPTLIPSLLLFLASLIGSDALLARVFLFVLYIYAHVVFYTRVPITEDARGVYWMLF